MEILLERGEFIKNLFSGCCLCRSRWDKISENTIFYKLDCSANLPHHIKDAFNALNQHILFLCSSASILSASNLNPHAANYLTMQLKFFFTVDLKLRRKHQPLLKNKNIVRAKQKRIKRGRTF